MRVKRRTGTVPAIPLLSTWQSKMVSGASTNCNQAAINAAIFAGAGTGGDESNVWYYDGNLVYQQIANYTGNAANYTCGGYVESAYGAWVDSIIGSATSPNQTLQGHRVFSHGFLNSWLRTGSTTARERVRRLALYSAFGDLNQTPSTTSTDGSRPVAYIMNAYIAAEYAGFGRNPHLAQAVINAKGHIDKWFVSHTIDGSGSLQPFMLGVELSALIYYYGLTGDATIPAYIKKACDGLFTDTVIMGRTFWDAPTNSFIQNTTQQTPAPVLNQLIASAYAWLWQMGFGTIYQQRFDLLFAGAAAQTIFSGKEFSQNYRASFDAVRWRQAPPKTLVMYPARHSAAGIPPG